MPARRKLAWEKTGEEEVKKKMKTKRRHRWGRNERTVAAVTSQQDNSCNFFYSICVTSSFVYEHFSGILLVQLGPILFCHQIIFFNLFLIDRNSVFCTFYSNFTIRLCVQLAVFPIVHTGFWPQVVFAHVYTFPNIMLTEFAIHRRNCSFLYFGGSNNFHQVFLFFWLCRLQHACIIR